MPTPQRQVAVITLGTGDLARSRRFYGERFGWEPTFANDEIVFYQMNGCVLATWLATAMAAGMGRPTPSLGLGGAFALAHNVATQGEVQPLLDRLAQSGGTSAAGRRAVARRLSRLRRRPGRARLGDRVEPGVADQPGRLRDVRRLTKCSTTRADLPETANRSTSLRQQTRGPRPAALAVVRLSFPQGGPLLLPPDRQPLLQPLE
jgi:catechol 2,3-dioxygenase-like lactoylglutathione lyase family enzyme